MKTIAFGLKTPEPDDIYCIEDMNTNTTIIAKELDTISSKISNDFIVSSTIPMDQSVGGLWLDTSDGAAEVAYGGIMISNAVVSEEPPAGNTEIWIQTTGDTNSTGIV